MRIYYKYIGEEEYIGYKNRREAEHDIAYRLLGAALLDAYGIDALPEIERGKYGKPYFADSGIHFNISHCSGLAVCAVGECENGIDCEEIGRVGMKAAKRIFSAEEYAELESAAEEIRPEIFARLWTFKEACGKTVGRGLGGELPIYGKSEEKGIFTCGFTLGDGRFMVTAAAKEPFDVPKPKKMCNF